MSELMLAVRRFGVCQRFYTDNGPCYASRHLKEVCARLGIHLVHTPPYRPQGRGKIERFFLTVREQFLSEQHAASLEQLNCDLQQYLAEYHQRPHRSLGSSPLQKRLAADNACRPLPEYAASITTASSNSTENASRSPAACPDPASWSAICPGTPTGSTTAN